MPKARRYHFVLILDRSERNDSKKMKKIQELNKNEFELSINNCMPLRQTPDMFDFSKKGEEWQYHANLGWSDQDFSHGYIEGFYKAAEMVVENGVHFYDYLVYPIIFCYRHYIELALKNLNLCCHLYFGETISFKKNHNIEFFLDEFTKILDKYQIGYMVPIEIRAAILKVNNIDKHNDRFRYAHDFNGALSHNYSNQFIDLKHFKLGMQQIHEYLELISIWFDEDSESRLTNFHFVNFISSFSNLKTGDQLTKGGELSKKTYFFDNSSISQKHPLSPAMDFCRDERKLYVDKSSINKNQSNMVECVINFASEENDRPFAKIEFNLNEKNKIVDFRVIE